KYRNESEYKKDNRSRMFLMHGLRIVISYGELKRFDKEKGIIDGDAIYKSGRLINQFSTSDTERVTIKNTIFFISDNNELTNKVQNIRFLIDVILGKTTTRQREILLMKLLGYNENDIAKLLEISQSSVNQSSTSSGWNEIEESIKYL